MVSDLSRLTRALRQDTPEQLLIKEIRKREPEIKALLPGQSLSIRDVVGRVIRFTRQRTVHEQ